MLTKQDVTTIWNECQSELKSKFPTYHKSIKDYKLKFGRKRRAYGTCKYGTKTIEIHMYLCKHVEKKDVRDTVLHEMAHAIDKEVNGYSSGHGRPWKRIATEIGCNPRSSSNKGGNVVKESKYVMVLDKGDGTFEYICGKHRKKRTIRLNEPIQGTWLRGRKRETLNKVVYISWNRFMSEHKKGNIDIKSMEMGI